MFGSFECRSWCAVHGCRQPGTGWCHIYHSNLPVQRQPFRVCADSSPFHHLTFCLYLSARIGQGRIVLVGLRGRDAGIGAILFGGAFHENGEDEFDNHEHAAHDSHLTLGLFDLRRCWLREMPPLQVASLTTALQDHPACTAVRQAGAFHGLPGLFLNFVPMAIRLCATRPMYCDAHLRLSRLRSLPAHCSSRRSQP